MALVSLILWKLLGVLFFVLLLMGSLVFLIKEVFFYRVHYGLGFWLFMFSEVAIFLTLFVTCFWFQAYDSMSISDCLELPFLGCFFLMGSSMTATGFHYSMGCETLWVWVSMRTFLFVTMLQGGFFMMLQMVEFHDCFCDFLFSPYCAASFSVVGLHFSHVLMGLIALAILWGLGLDLVSKFHLDVVVWYWHFVDYMWLLVYSVVYLV